MKIITTFEPLKAAAAFCSREATRYYLNGVYVETEKDVLVATDGRRLAAIKPDTWVKEGEEKPFILPRLVIEGLRSMEKAESNAFESDEDNEDDDDYSADAGNNILLIDTDKKIIAIATMPNIGFPVIGKFDEVMEKDAFAILGYKPIDGKFPDCAKVLPNQDQFDPPGGVAEFNPVYLASFSKLGNCVRFYMNKDKSMPCVLRAKDGLRGFEAVGVLMPMRWDTENVPLYPEWLWFKPQEDGSA